MMVVLYRKSDAIEALIVKLKRNSGLTNNHNRSVMVVLYRKSNAIEALRVKLKSPMRIFSWRTMERKSKNGHFNEEGE